MARPEPNSHRSILVLVAAVALLLAAAPSAVAAARASAAAGTLAFVRADHVWVAAADGSGAYQLTKGTAADLTNASAKRKAGTIYAGSFLEEFVDERPWVQLDIAGTAWDVGREYVGKGPTGYGARLLVELARSGSDT